MRALRRSRSSGLVRCRRRRDASPRLRWHRAGAGENDLAFDPLLTHAGEELQAVHAGHLEIGQDEPELSRLDLLPRLFAVCGHLRRVPVVREDHLEPFGDVTFVVGDEELGLTHGEL